EVQLPTGAHQLHEIPAFLTAGDNPRIRVQLVSGDRVLVETPVQMQHNWGSNDQLELLVVDTDPTTLNSISAAQIQQQPSREPFKLAARSTPQPATPNITIGTGGGPPVRRGPRGFNPSFQVFTAHPTVIAPEDLPRDFVSYDLTDVLVINEAPLSQLNEDQARAVRLWVASGGLLVVSGAADLAGMRANRLDELL